MNTLITFADVLNEPESRITDYYVRDAQGNPLATYKRYENRRNPVLPTDELYLSDWTMYGSARIGTSTVPDNLLASNNQPVSWSGPVTFVNNADKRFELTNHLGNVLATITGEVDYIDTVGMGNWQYTQPQISTVQDYYAFGMLKPGRTFSAGDYRFGFNSAENLNEISGISNTLDLGERMYNSRLGKMFSPDPLEAKYPWQSTYAYFKNSPIAKIDWKGCGDGEDWIKNNETGEYTWDNNVTKPSNTPAGYTYVGHEDNAIVEDMFEKGKYSDQATELVAVSTEDFDNPYQAQGYATIHANVFSKMNVLINPMVSTTYNTDGSVNSKTFDGLKMDIWASSLISPSGTDLNYTQPVLTVNSVDFSQTLVNLSAERIMKINGQDIKYKPAIISDADNPVSYQLNSTIYFKSEELLKHKNTNMSFNFKFSADLWSGNKPLTIPTVLGSVSGQANTVRMGINFSTR